ncbi:two-component system LytT family response regulator [Pedobacter sp. UYP24]
MVLNAIIVDDEEFARSSLYFLIQENCDNIHVIGIAKSVAEARTILLNNKTDLVFLDIAMPGENGFELISNVRENNAHIIFTTAYDQYALKAIKANALDYLLKPIDIDELKEAVDRAAKYIALSRKGDEKNDNLLNLSQQLSDRSEIKKISLPNGQGYSLVSLADIIHIEADSNYSIFYLAGGEKITVSKVLKEYEELLPDHQFIRIHKSSIVNLDYLNEYNSKNGLEVTLKNGDRIAVSRRRASDFLEKVKSYTSLENEK